MRVIRLGDRTSHGGEVITAADNYEIMGKKVARENDMVTCPIPGHRGGGIIGGDKNWTINGRAVALEGPSMAPCGAQIFSSCSQLDRTFEGDGEAGLGAISDAALSADPPAANKNHAYDQRFFLTDSLTGVPLARQPYRLEYEGEILQGETDEEGYTAPIKTGSQSATVVWSILGEMVNG